MTSDGHVLILLFTGNSTDVLECSQTCTIRRKLNEIGKISLIVIMRVSAIVEITRGRVQLRGGVIG